MHTCTFTWTSSTCEQCRDQSERFPDPVSQIFMTQCKYPWENANFGLAWLRKNNAYGAKKFSCPSTNTDGAVNQPPSLWGISWNMFALRPKLWSMPLRSGTPLEQYVRIVYSHMDTPYGSMNTPAKRGSVQLWKRGKATWMSGLILWEKSKPAAYVCPKPSIFGNSFVIFF